ncbi:MAG TPA: hypothetical protein VMT88_12555 [Actinomycetes bacterium]|nr:hypothetical protein [Actinomycetes bacterium]
MDRLTSEPKTSLASVFNFLGVDDAPAARIEVATSNTFGGGESSRQGEARERKQRDRGELPSGRYPPMSDSTRQRLREHFAAMNAELSQWLGQDLSHWQ